MPFTNDDIRASHTIRIFGTNRDGSVLQDIWLDIERVDIIRIVTKISGRWQGVYRRLKWLDDPASDDYSPDGNPARLHGSKKICSPDEADQEDPSEWVPVRTIIELAWNESTDHNQLNARRGNRTDAENLVRLVEARRCFHHDTIIDEEVNAATASDPDLKAYVVASNEYGFVENSEDRGQFLEVQYVSCTMDLSSNKEDEGKNHGVQFSLKNSHYLNFTDPAEGPANPTHGFDPPWALDPFQAIVNVQFGFSVYVIIVAEGSYATVDPDKGATILETHTDPTIPGITGAPVTATLIQCTANIGADFAGINLVAGSPTAAERLEVIVAPKSDNARDHWFTMYVVPISRDRIRPTAPYLWLLNTMEFTAARLVQFKLRYAPHIIGPTDAGSVPIVEIYPNTTPIGGTVELRGYSISAYRIDRKGTETLFTQPPGWSIHDVRLISGTVVQTGLLFGVDPPLIAADVPL